MDGPGAPAGPGDRDEIAGGAEPGHAVRWRRLIPPGGRGAGLAGAVAAVLLASVVGPGLLSGSAPTPDRPTGQRGAEPSSRDARSWTGGATREHGNRFVQSGTRLLRLPA